MYIPSRFVKVISPLAIAIALTACGGGSSFGSGNSSSGEVTDSGTGGERPTETAAVSSIDLNADSLQLLSDGSKPVFIKAIAKDDKNNSISDASFEFTVDNSATLVVNGDSAVLTPGDAVIGDELTVTVTSGEITKTIFIKVIKKEEQVQGGEVVDAIDLRYESKHLLFDGSKSLNITAIAKNDDNVAISADVKFSATGSVTLEVTGNSVKVTSDGANPGETVTVTAQSGNVTKILDLLVIRKEEQAESDIKLGSGDGSNFEAGKLAIQKDHLKAGEQTLIKVFLVDTTTNNELVSDATSISFNSRCIAEGTATISDVEFNSGVATVNYQAKGCAGTDTVTATAVVGGKTISAASDITVDAAIVGSIAFNEAAPSNIGLAGMGLIEVSTVSFTVLDTEGNPVVNQLVDFSLSNTFGGAYLTNTTAKTDANGKAIARVHSGTKATTIKVLASVDTGTKIVKTESRGLVISTGVADEDSFSISLETLNPEALSFDGVISKVFVQAADHFNNPVPEDTAVSFTTEAGSITSSCFIDNKGSCSVEWKSGGTRPTDGRSTITASMQGEESFTDENDNGLLDETESFDDINGDGKYNGLLCQTANPNCSDTKTIKISKQIDIVMSGSFATFDIPSSVEIVSNGIEPFEINIADSNGQRMPAGTTVGLSIKSFGSTEDEPPHTLVSETSFIVPNANHNSSSKFDVMVKDGGTGLSSVLQILVTTPRGSKSVDYINLIPKGTLQEPTLASKLNISASSNKILADGSLPVTITATAKDDDNNVLNGISIEFSVNKDAEIRPTSLNTAELKPGDTPKDEVLTVTARIKDASGTLIVEDTFDVNVVESFDQTESKAAFLDFNVNSNQLFSAGTDPVILSAIVKDNNNNTIKDEVVTFSVNNGGTITVDENIGVVKTATLTPGSKENRTLEVTATVGAITKIINVYVVGTTISAEGPATIATDKPTDYIIKLQDSADKAIADTLVDISTNSGTITPTSAQTDSHGQLKVSLVSSNTSDVQITASALGASVTKDVKISGNDFTLTGTDLNGDGTIDSDDFELKLGDSEEITVKWLVDGGAQENEIISVRTTRGSLFKLDDTDLDPSEVVTDVNGEAKFKLKSDTAGTATITIETVDGLTANLEREFVATTPKYLDSQASPSLIAPNKSSTIITKVRDINDNPVKNVEVHFNLTDAINGDISSSRAVTDSLGRARVVYTAGDSTSGLEGVTINTYLNDTSFGVPEAPVTLTVGGDSLRIVLGGDNKLQAEGTFYTKIFGVIVTDSAGNPVENQKVDFTLTATDYIKGYMEKVAIPPSTISSTWVQRITTQPGTSSCPSEDFDNDGKLDEGEDQNGNNRLDPTQAASATVVGTGVTGSRGELTVEILYPRSEALWSIQRLTAKTVVAGSEYVENTSFVLPIAATDVSTGQTSVPNQLSPYGQANNCSIAD